MIVKTVTQVGNPLIRTRTKPVGNPKSKIVQQVIKNLTDSMRHHSLVGMAAPQIGKNMRVFVSEVRKTKLRKAESVRHVDPLRIFVNPKIIRFSQRKEKGWEGCGSVASANLFGRIERSKSVLVTAFDEKGTKFKLEASGLLARIIQHEMDHLNGIVFTDAADPKSFMSRNEYLKKRAKKK